MTSLPMHNMVKIAAFGGLFFAATFVAERHPDFYGEWSTILPVLVMISMFANLCLSPGSSCLALILFWCSIGALLVYEGERADRRATHEMEVGTIVFSMLHIGLLLVVCTSRGIAKLIFPSPRPVPAPERRRAGR